MATCVYQFTCLIVAVLQVNDLNMCLRSLDFSLALSREVKDTGRDSDILGEIADVYTELGDLEKAGKVCCSVHNPPEGRAFMPSLCAIAVLALRLTVALGGLILVCMVHCRTISALGLVCGCRCLTTKFCVQCSFMICVLKPCQETVQCQKAWSAGMHRIFTQYVLPGNPV